MRRNVFPCVVLSLLASCSSVPAGPSVAVMPAMGKPFDLFQSEEGLCRNYAAQQLGLSPQQAMGESTVTGAAIGTAVGAAAGVAMGSVVGHAGEGAVIGSGIGLLEGSAIGASSGRASSWTVQQRYDIAYEQCMYAKGNQLPGYASAPSVASSSFYPPPPPQ